jgi:hypothetical protein
MCEPRSIALSSGDTAVLCCCTYSPRQRAVAPKSKPFGITPARNAAVLAGSRRSLALWHIAPKDVGVHPGGMASVAASKTLVPVGFEFRQRRRAWNRRLAPATARAGEADRHFS